jgi:hypothetical protein
LSNELFFRPKKIFSKKRENTFQNRENEFQETESPNLQFQQQLIENQKLVDIYEFKLMEKEKNAHKKKKELASVKNRMDEKEKN